MTRKTKCPDPKWFHRLADGNVTEEQEQKLSRHLERCKRCQATLDALSDVSGFLDDTRGPDTPTISSARELGERLHVLKSQKPKASSPAASSGFLDVMPWIDQSDQGLGRIDEFEILEFVGRGGMGLVFRCLDTTLQRVVALKLMSPQLLVEKSASERFLREARAAASVNHPNVVTVHSVAEVRGLPYLVMEYVDGHSLESVLQGKDAIPFSEIERIAVQATTGLSAAHGMGLLHRDVKPANIMLDWQTGQVKITDFGLACTTEGSGLTQTGFLVGTPEFLSPEQAAGGKIDERSDLFSLGSVIYAMCCGTSPFASPSMMSTLDKLRSHKPTTVTETNPGIPQWFGSIVGRLLEKDPRDRFESASETLVALQQKSSVESLPKINVTTDRPGLRDDRSGKRSATALIAFSAIAILLVVGGTLAGMGYFRADQDQQADGSANANSTPVGRERDLKDKPEEAKPVRSEENNDSVASRTVSSFRQLMEAVSLPHERINIQIEAGSEIELRGRVQVFEKEVSISSAKDDKAKLHIVHTGKSAFSVIGGTLQIRDVEILAEHEHEDEDYEPLIYCSEGSLEINGSSIVCAVPQTCIELDRADGSISNSLIRGVGNAIEWNPESNDNRLVIENSLIASTIGIFREGQSSAHLRLERTSIITEHALSFTGESFEAGEIIIESLDSILLATEGLILIEESEGFAKDEHDELVDRLELTGSGNLLPPILIRGDSEESELEIRTTPFPENLDVRESAILSFDDLERFEDLEVTEDFSRGSLVRLSRFLRRFEVAGADLQSLHRD